MKETSKHRRKERGTTLQITRRCAIQSVHSTVLSLCLKRDALFELYRKRFLGGVVESITAESGGEGMLESSEVESSKKVPKRVAVISRLYSVIFMEKRRRGKSTGVRYFI